MELPNKLESQSENTKFYKLGSDVLSAVISTISDITGKDYPFNHQHDGVNSDPGQVAMAVAYASLFADEPEMVTNQHLKMLRNKFSFEEIQELNQFIKGILNQAPSGV